MQLSTTLLWIVSAGSVVSHPTGLSARSTTATPEPNNDRTGNVIGNLVDSIFEKPVQWVAGGTGLALLSEPMIRRWAWNRLERRARVTSSTTAATQPASPADPIWFEKFSRYFHMSPDQREAEGHQTLREMEFEEEEKQEISSCKWKRFETWREDNPDKAPAAHVPLKYEDVPDEIKDQAEIHCRYLALHKRANVYRVMRHRQQQQQQRRAAKGISPDSAPPSDTNHFSLNNVKIPSLSAVRMPSLSAPNVAAIGGALNKAGSRMTLVKPNYMPVRIL